MHLLLDHFFIGFFLQCFHKYRTLDLFIFFIGFRCITVTKQSFGLKKKTSICSILTWLVWIGSCSSITKCSRSVNICYILSFYVLVLQKHLDVTMNKDKTRKQAYLFIQVIPLKTWYTPLRCKTIHNCECYKGPDLNSVENEKCCVRLLVV